MSIEVNKESVKEQLMSLHRMSNKVVCAAITLSSMNGEVDILDRFREIYDKNIVGIVTHGVEDEFAAAHHVFNNLTAIQAIIDELIAQSKQGRS